MIPSSSVLIIEDDPALLRGLSDNFRAAGYEVDTAVDGQLGLARAMAQPPDLIVLDIMLPKLNGYDVCRQIRQAKLGLPIVMLSAKGQEDEIVRGLELGADDYMTKPFGIRELLARSKRLLLRRSGDVANTIQIGSAVLDRIARQLTRDGVRIELTTKEYALLELFVTRPHRALTRSEILNRVWGNSLIVSSRSVDRCVATLRGKLEVDASHPRFIQTIRDVGYRFECE